MRNQLITLLGAFGILLSSFSTASSFEGFSVGVVYGDTDFTTKGTESDNKGVAGAAPEITTGTSPVQNHDIYSYFLEYTSSQGSTFGVELIPDGATVGTKTRELDGDTGQSGSGEDGTGTQTAKGEVSDHITYYVEPTIMLGEGFGVFVKGGAANVTVATKETMVTNSTYGDQDVWGVMTGFGAKAYYGNFFAKLEYVETEYGEVALQSTTGNKNQITADIDSEATRIAIGYNF
jgi:hypothetical protein